MNSLLLLLLKEVFTKARRLPKADVFLQPSFLFIFKILCLSFFPLNSAAGGINSVSCTPNKSLQLLSPGSSVNLATMMLIVHEKHIKTVNHRYFQAGWE